MITTIIKRIIYLLIALIVVLSSPFIWFNYRLESISTNRENYPRIAIVFGASVLSPTKPSLVLQKRLDTAAKLYNEDLVEKILVSGDNRADDYNEPLTMINYLTSQGVDTENIVADYAGVRTIESCYRAAEVFGVKSAYLITQRFHLPRANFLCSQFGIDTVPQIANDSSNQVSIWGYIREVPASLMAFFEVYGYQSSYEPDGSEPDLSIF